MGNNPTGNTDADGGCTWCDFAQAASDFAKDPITQYRAWTGDMTPYEHRSGETFWGFNEAPSPENMAYMIDRAKNPEYWESIDNMAMTIGSIVALFTPGQSILSLFKSKGAAQAVVTGRATYEAEVRGLSSVVAKMTANGSSAEEIAIAVHSLRRELGVKYKAITDSKLLEQIYQRNLQKYGDKLGPTIDYLRNVVGKSWDDIINSATKPGGKDLGF